MFSKFILGIWFMSATVLVMGQQRPVNVILDTDIAGDYDDVGAMAVLHNLADRNEVNILAVMSCNVFPTTVPTISVLNQYFKRPDIPVGVTKGTFPNMDCPQKWAEALIEKYPHNIRSNDDAPDAVQLYRKILSSQDDHSVTIISIGFFTNLSNLLKSSPDTYSPLNGKELVRKKVKHLVSMAAGIEPDKNSGREYNVYIDTEASKTVFKEWPTPVILSGFEIGKKILTGIKLIQSDSIVDSPVKDAYQIALTKDKNTIGRMSWDQTAVLVGIRGIKPHFTVKKLNFEIKDDGSNIVIPGKKFSYLQFASTPGKIRDVIEGLMME